MTRIESGALPTASRSIDMEQDLRAASVQTAALLTLAAVSAATAIAGLLVYTVAVLAGRSGYNSQTSALIATAHSVICLGGMGVIRVAKGFSARATLSRLVFAVVVGLTFLTYLELAAGVWFPRTPKRESMYVSARDVGWRMRPNYCTDYVGVQVCTNEDGFRSPSLPLEKTPGVVRVVCLGDSLTFGHGVATEDAYPQQLGNLLQTRFPLMRWQVLNAGVEGYSTFQATAELRRCLKYKPDFAILLFCLNDVTEKYQVLRSFGGTGLDYHGVVDGSSGLVLKLLVRLRHYSALARAMTPSAPAARRQEAFAVGRLWEQPLPTHIAEAWEQAEHELDELAALCEREQIGLLVAVAPHKAQVVGDSATNAPQRRLERWAQGQPVVFVDVLSQLRGILAGNRASVDALFLDDGHFTGEGNQAIATMIAARFEKDDRQTQAQTLWHAKLRDFRRR